MENEAYVIDAKPKPTKWNEWYREIDRERQREIEGNEKNCNENKRQTPALKLKSLTM